MKHLFNTYKGFLLGMIFVIIGVTLLFSTILFLMPYKPIHDYIYMEIILVTFKYTTIIISSGVVFFLGINYMSDNEESKELTRNIKQIFTKKL